MPPLGLQVPLEAAYPVLSASERRILLPFVLRSSAGRLEVDLQALSVSGHARYAELLYRYFTASRAAAGVPGLPQVHLQYPLVDVSQSTSKSSLSDLNEHLHALQQVPGCAPLLAALDAAPPSRLPGCRTTRTSSGLLKASCDVEAPLWPDLLGGAPSPFERFRRVSVFVSHAPWRDRRVRRLVRLQLVSHQEWLDPSALPAPA